MRNHPDLILEKHLTLFENIGYMTQIANENEEFMLLLGIISPKFDDKIEKKAALRETLLNKEFMEIKDFFYNIGKSICIPTVMESKVYRPRFL